MDQHKNLAYSLIATAPSPAVSGTSLTVTAGQGARFPATPFNATVCAINEMPTPANAEIVRVTGIAGDVFTITRATATDPNNNTARSILVGDQIFAAITDKTLDDLAATIGPAGAPGPPGIPGRDGLDGEDGIGWPGPPGLQGTAGTSGAAGLAGSIGPPGLDGADGYDGEQGIPGAQGTAGPIGATGVQGSIGVPGIDGDDGVDGERGIPGQRGDPGTPGAAGLSGLPGVPGLDGEDGIDGTDGRPGSTGPSGPSGATGPMGPIGPPGLDSDEPELPHYIPGPPGPPSGGGWGTATLDFGAFPGGSDASVAVTGQSAMVAGSVVEAWLRPTTTADHTADEHLVETLLVMAGNIIAGTGFTIYGRNTSQLNEPLTPSLGVMNGFGIAAAGPAQNPMQQQYKGGIGTRLYGAWSVAWRWV